FKSQFLGSKSNLCKNVETHVYKIFLTTRNEAALSQPLDKRRSISCPSVLAQKRQNMRSYFSIFFSHTQVITLISQPLLS
ncbi:hypothetical protein, partial [Enterococcus faecium]